MEQPRELTVEAPRAWDRPAVSVPVLVCLSLVGGQLPSFSTAGEPLHPRHRRGADLARARATGCPAGPPPRRLAPGAVWWLLPVTVFGVFEGATFVLSVGDDFPTFSRLADPLLEDHLVRSAAWFAWLAAFWGLVRR